MATKVIQQLLLLLLKTSISFVPAQPNHSQIVKYNPNSTFQNFLEEAQQIYKNQITDSTQLQYLSAKTAFVVIIFKNYRSYILPPYIDQYKEWYENESTIKFAKNVKASSQDLQLVNTDVFLTDLLSVKRENKIVFTFSCYDGKLSAFMQLISQSGNTQDDNKKDAMENMMKGLKKTIAKEISERQLLVIEGKEHMSFKYYQRT